MFSLFTKFVVMLADSARAAAVVVVVSNGGGCIIVSKMSAEFIAWSLSAVMVGWLVGQGWAFLSRGLWSKH
jgi:hypothetical protein